MHQITNALKLSCLSILVLFISCKSERKITREKHSSKASLRWKIGSFRDDKKIADEMMSFMNQTIDPCDDFFKYSCGGFLQKHDPPPNGKTHSLMKEMAMSNKNVLEIFFKFTVKGVIPAKNKATKDAVAYHKSCLDADSKMQEGNKPLLDLLETLGTWSILEKNFDGNVWNDSLAMTEMAKMGFHPVFKTYVSQNPFQTDEILIFFDQPSFEYLGKLRTLRKRDSIELLIQALQGMALFLGAEEGRLENIEKLYKDLSPIIKAVSRQRKSLKRYDNMTKMTLEEFSKKTKIELQSLLGHVNELLAPSGERVDKDEIVAVLGIETIIAAQEVFLKMNAEMRSLFLLSPVVWYSSNYLMGEFKWFRNFLYNVHLHEPKSSLDTSSEFNCFESTKKYYARVLWRIFADKRSNPEAVQDATNLVEDLREAMIDKLNSVTWMDNRTRQQAVEKIQVAHPSYQVLGALSAISMVTNIAYPDELVTDDSLEKYYKDIDPDPEQYLLNLYKLLRKDSERMYSMYGKPFDREMWKMDVFTTNARNAVLKNKITVPTAFIQRRLYNPKAPRSFNYGALGMVVGHEIGHSYDWNGRKFDADGNLVNWWSNGSIVEYEKRAKCFRDQYSSQAYEGKFENGKRTLGENIADSEGLEIAFKAYKNYVKAHGIERTLPGIQLSNDKLFFLGFGQTFCQIYSKKFAHSLIDKDVHALAPIRVRETLKNSPEFAAAYKCPVGSTMNPSVRCNIF